MSQQSHLLAILHTELVRSACYRYPYSNTLLVTLTSHGLDCYCTGISNFLEH